MAHHRPASACAHGCARLPSIHPRSAGHPCVVSPLPFAHRSMTASDQPAMLATSSCRACPPDFSHASRGPHARHRGHQFGFASGSRRQRATIDLATLRSAHHQRRAMSLARRCISSSNRRVGHREALRPRRHPGRYHRRLTGTVRGSALRSRRDPDSCAGATGRTSHDARRSAQGDPVSTGPTMRTPAPLRPAAQAPARIIP